MFSTLLPDASRMSWHACPRNGTDTMTRDPPAGEPDSSIETEIAIVGAGPAGIVLALELAGKGHRIVVIESGADSFDRDTQELGESVGEDPLHVPMSLATRRQLGGASNLWGGRCVPFDPVDFEPREIVGDARWPVSYEEMAGYFQRACDWCICGDAAFDARDVPVLAGNSLVPGFGEGRVSASSLERWSLPTNFAREYAARLADAPNVTLITGFTCTEVICRPSGSSVEALLAKSLNGQTMRICASRYVLAAGGLETTRLLFASDRRHPGGLGNHSGHLGRWYMAHMESRIARVHFATRPQDTIYGHERDAAGVYVRRRLTFAADFQIAERLPNVAIWLVNPELGNPDHRSGVLSFVYLMLASPAGRFFVAEGIRQAHLGSSSSSSLRRHLANVARDLGPAARFAATFGYERFLRRGRKVPGFFVPSPANAYPLMYHGEHLPNWDSHVEPAGVRDALGMPRLRTHLRFSEEDISSVLRVHEHLDGYLRETGLGHLEYPQGREDVTPRKAFGGYHQAGTTRMSATPEDGVVDRDLAVHGLEDLFVASSSTFVTSGQANSTFMIVAFALRLADHLHAQSRSPSESSAIA
jgi:choline dehydrogenase-like flavoprotein